MKDSPRVSVLFSTRNRREELLCAIASCLAQDYEDVEILVYDDGSNDGTAAAVAANFPHVRLVRYETQVGSITCRNRGFREASGEVVVSLDDDAYFTDSSTITRIVQEFEKHPRAGALALPYVEPYAGRSSTTNSELKGCCLRAYVGCAAALRRAAVLECGGYCRHFFHHGEERDLCIRLLDAGYDIRYADTPPIVHRYSPKRNREQVEYFGYRNTLLFHWMRTPHPYLYPHLVLATVQLLRYKFSWRRLPIRIKALAAGWWGCVSCRKERRRVSRATYRQYRSLPSHGPSAYPDHLPAPVVLEPAAFGDDAAADHAD